MLNIHSLILLACLVDFVTCHPQCLDFGPPFERSNERSFCSQYLDFGCCTKERDFTLEELYNDISSQLETDDLEHCADMVKDILCQQCSPYAAHIYDSESTQVTRPFPGLCTDFCNTFFTNCSQVVKYISNDTGLTQSLISMETFCDYITLSDMDYCYPDLLANDILNRDITIESRTQKGCLCVEKFDRNLIKPVILLSPPDGSQRIFIGDMFGLVFIYFKNKTKLETPFLDLRSAVKTTNWLVDERGLLGLVFHPRYKDNRKLYVFYTTRLPGFLVNRVSEFLTAEDDANSVDLSSEEILLEAEQSYPNHNGGQMLFGTDGYLYIFLGDGGSAGDPHNYAQNKSSLNGKVLRIDVDSPPDSGLAYKIPEDNPFVNETGTRPEIFAYGFRNPWRCDFDEGDITTGSGYGRMLCGDVGQGSYEEIDLIEKGGNYGWNAREGPQCFRNDICGNIGPEILPIHSYPHSVGKSVIGGHVYRGCMSPNLYGLYIFGDYDNGKLYSLKEDVNTGQWTRNDITMCGDDVCFNGITNKYPPRILSFGEDDDGEIYILSTKSDIRNEGKAAVSKLVDPRRRGDPTKCRSYRAAADHQISVDKVCNNCCLPNVNRHNSCFQGCLLGCTG